MGSSVCAIFGVKQIGQVGGRFLHRAGPRWSGGAALSPTNRVKPRLKVPRPPRSGGSNPVSGRRLPKTGIFQYPPETIGDFCPEVAKFGIQRPTANSQKPAIGEH